MKQHPHTDGPRSASKNSQPLLILLKGIIQFSTFSLNGTSNSYGAWCKICQHSLRQPIRSTLDWQCNGKKHCQTNTVEWVRLERVSARYLRRPGFTALVQTLVRLCSEQGSQRGRLKSSGYNHCEQLKISQFIYHWSQQWNRRSIPWVDLLSLWHSHR